MCEVRERLDAILAAQGGRVTSLALTDADLFLVLGFYLSSADLGAARSFLRHDPERPGLRYRGMPVFPSVDRPTGVSHFAEYRGVWFHYLPLDVVDETTSEPCPPPFRQFATVRLIIQLGTWNLEPGTALHPWHVTPDEAVALQTQLAARVNTSTPLGPVRLVAGCDIAYAIDSPLAFAAVVVWDVVRKAELTRAVVREEMTFPYVPGLLSFRECPPLLSAFKALRVVPDAVFLDGQGACHPRRFGLACHLGLWLDLPTVGCAKTWLTGDHGAVGPTAGDTTPLTLGDDVVGAVVRTADRVRPCFVSPGHKCDVPSAVDLVKVVLGGYRHPTPTRLAHMAANAARAEFIAALPPT